MENKLKFSFVLYKQTVSEINWSKEFQRKFNLILVNYSWNGNFHSKLKYNICKIVLTCETVFLN